jgi:hypothetical protein
MLGYYTSNMKSVGLMHKVEVVEYVNSLGLQMGFRHGNMPAVPLRVAQNIGLVGIRGVNIARSTHNESNSGQARGRGARGKPTKSSERVKYIQALGAQAAHDIIFGDMDVGRERNRGKSTNKLSKRVPFKRNR